VGQHQAGDEPTRPQRIKVLHRKRDKCLGFLALLTVQHQGVNKHLDH
jgi:hypothetical protein